MTAECPTFGQNRLDLVVGQTLPDPLRTAQAGDIPVTLPDCGVCDNRGRLLSMANSVFGAKNVRVFHAMNPPRETDVYEWRSVTDLGATEFRPVIVVVGADKSVETVLRSDSEIKTYASKNL